jgi:hypothetical protein
VGELPVDGPGSRALLQIGGSGEVEGLTRVWKTAKTVEMVKPSLSPEQVRAAIIEQLLPSIENSEVTVNGIELAYYDANREFLRPVYRFTARIHQITMPQTPARANDNFVIGYLPFARAFEPLPVLGQHTGPEPSAAEPKPNPTLQQPGKRRSCCWSLRSEERRSRMGQRCERLLGRSCVDVDRRPVPKLAVLLGRASAFHESEGLVHQCHELGAC